MIIITGGAGFIGSAVAWGLNEKGIEDLLIVDNLNHSEKWKNLVNRKYLDYVHRSDFLHRLEASEYKDVEAIIHMGACSSTTERDADFLFENNLRYSTRIAQYALKHGIRMINASSAATYGDGKNGFSDNPATLDQLKPLNMYGYSKHRFDLWAVKTGAMDKLVSLKFFNVFGPNEYHKGDQSSVVFKAVHQVRENGCIKLFKSYHKDYEDGGQRRDFVYVKDCVDIILWFMETPAVNGLFNVGTGKDRSWNALANAVFQAMNRKTDIKYIDMPVQLRDRYQYFTQARMENLRSKNYPVQFHALEAAISDYVQNYLMTDDPYL